MHIVAAGGQKKEPELPHAVGSRQASFTRTLIDEADDCSLHPRAGRVRDLSYEGTRSASLRLHRAAEDDGDQNELIQGTPDPPSKKTFAQLNEQAKPVRLRIVGAGGKRPTDT